MLKMNSNESISSLIDQTGNVNKERSRAVKNKVVVTHVGCKACFGSEVARSRAKGVGKVINLILPLAAFRCLGCYNRFWSVDTFFGNKIRVLLWLVALIAVVAFNLK